MKKIFIGIDFSKEKFDATMLLTVDGMVKSSDCPYSSFGNNQKGFKSSPPGLQNRHPRPTRKIFCSVERTPDCTVST